MNWLLEGEIFNSKYFYKQRLPVLRGDELLIGRVEETSHYPLHGQRQASVPEGHNSENGRVKNDECPTSPL
jgi:hypothetical protein